MGMLNNLYSVSLVYPGKFLKMCCSLCVIVHTVLVHVKANDASLRTENLFCSTFDASFADARL